MPIDALLALNVQGHAGPNENQYAGGVVFTATDRLATPVHRGIGGRHSEPDMGRDLVRLIERIANGTVQVYTYSSPCTGCTAFLNGLIQHCARHALAVHRWELYWTQEWIPTALRDARRVAVANQTAATDALAVTQQNAQVTDQNLRAARMAAAAAAQARFHSLARLDAAQKTRERLETALRLTGPAARAVAQQRLAQGIERENDAAGGAAYDQHLHDRAQQALQAAQQAFNNADAAFRAAQAASAQANGVVVQVQTTWNNHLQQQATNRVALATGGWTLTQI